MSPVLRSLAATTLAAGLFMPATPASASSDVSMAMPASTTVSLDRVRASMTPVRDAELEAIVAAQYRLADVQLVRLTGVPAVATEFSVVLPIDGREMTLRLAPHAIRSADGYRLLVDDGSPALRDWTPGPVRTVRGTVDGRPELAVAGGLVGGGLKVQVFHADGRRTVAEPVRIPGVDADLHVVYDAAASLPMPGHGCGNEGFVIDAPAGADAGAGNPPSSPVSGGQIDVAELACDADFEYFQDYGSVEEVEARITTVMNTVNLQYEGQVGITHQITTIIVRTTSNDPYTQSDSFNLLCEFITEWTNNQGQVPRDVAQLFTGRDVASGTIGRAADIGGTGICVNEGGCSGGQFGTFGSYCFSESDFNGNFVSATDLSAHELGHLWGAFHCSCPSFTMNPFITSANNFSGGSISSISTYRDTRNCLNVESEVPTPGPCCLPNNVCVTVEFASDCVNSGGTFLGEDADCVDCASLVGACCLPSGTCITLDEATCVAAGGVFAGNGTSCADDPCGPDCPADVDGNNVIEFEDLLSVLAAFGDCDGCPQDVDVDGTVGFSDLLSVLAAFGPCP